MNQRKIIRGIGKYLKINEDKTQYTNILKPGKIGPRRKCIRKDRNKSSIKYLFVNNFSDSVAFPFIPLIILYTFLKQKI